MRKVHWVLIVGTLAPLAPAGSAAQVRPTLEVHGARWGMPDRGAAGIGAFVGGSSRWTAAGLLLDLVPPSPGSRGFYSLQAAAGPRLSVSPALRLGVDVHGGALRTYGSVAIPVAYLCARDVTCVTQSPTLSDGWSGTLGGDVAAELAASPQVLFVGRYGLSRIFGTNSGVRLTAVGLGVLYRMR